MQKRLREQVNELLTNFAGRVGNQAERFKKITDFLKQSVPEMQTAEGKLQAASPDTALPPEHRALEFLQKAEEEYETQVSAASSRAAAGGGGQQKMADELANLFELEVDKMANQYETPQRASQQQADQKIDELAEKLKELARRQEQEAERAAAARRRGRGRGAATRSARSPTRRRKRRGSSRSSRARRTVRSSSRRPGACSRRPTRCGRRRRTAIRTRRPRPPARSSS